MKEKIFLDTNIFSFFSDKGKDFDETLKRLLDQGVFVTDVKSLQEIVYRYHLIGETDLGYEKAKKVRNEIEILPVTKDDLDKQEELLDRYPLAAPRELLRTAVMLNNNIKSIVCSPDSGYKEIEDVKVLNILSKIYKV